MFGEGKAPEAENKDEKQGKADEEKKPKKFFS